MQRLQVGGGFPAILHAVVRAGNHGENSKSQPRPTTSVPKGAFRALGRQLRLRLCLNFSRHETSRTLCRRFSSLGGRSGWSLVRISFFAGLAFNFSPNQRSGGGTDFFSCCSPRGHGRSSLQRPQGGNRARPRAERTLL